MEGLALLVGVLAALLVGTLPSGRTQELIEVCRDCTVGDCLAVPRAEGGCEACICNGLLMSDCQQLNCSADCDQLPTPDGCLDCVCPDLAQEVCPPIPACPSRCQVQLGSGCPRCTCPDEVPSQCPAVTCPPTCTEITGPDGCPACECPPEEKVCPEMPACPLGCIAESTDPIHAGCLECNCTIIEELLSENQIIPEEPIELLPVDFDEELVTDSIDAGLFLETEVLDVDLTPTDGIDPTVGIPTESFNPNTPQDPILVDDILVLNPDDFQTFDLPNPFLPENNVNTDDIPIAPRIGPSSNPEDNPMEPQLGPNVNLGNNNEIPQVGPNDNAANDTPLAPRGGPDNNPGNNPISPEVGPNTNPLNNNPSAPAVGSNNNPMSTQVGPNNNPMNPQVGPNNNPVSTQVGPNNNPMNPQVGPNNNPTNQQVGPNDNPRNPQVGPNGNPANNNPLAPRGRPNTNPGVNPMSTRDGTNSGPQNSPGRQNQRPPVNIPCGETSCPPGCTLCIQNNSCGRCLCGNAARICPAVPACQPACITAGPGGCFSCSCPAPGSALQPLPGLQFDPVLGPHIFATGLERFISEESFFPHPGRLGPAFVPFVGGHGGRSGPQRGNRGPELVRRGPSPGQIAIQNIPAHLLGTSRFQIFT